jgi:hypothetical protein
MRVLRNKIDFSTLRLVYFALFQSHICYGIVLWGNSSQCNIDRVLRLQKNAIKILAGLDNNESCKKYFMELDLLTVIGLYIFELLTFVKINMANIEQEPVTHKHNTRHKNSFIRPQKHYTSKYEKSTSYTGIFLYTSYLKI